MIKNDKISVNVCAAGKQWSQSKFHFSCFPPESNKNAILLNFCVQLDMSNTLRRFIYFYLLFTPWYHLEFIEKWACGRPSGLSRWRFILFHVDEVVYLARAVADFRQISSFCLIKNHAGAARAAASSSHLRHIFPLIFPFHFALDVARLIVRWNLMCAIFLN